MTDLCMFKRGADLGDVIRVNGEDRVTCAGITHSRAALPQSQWAWQS